MHINILTYAILPAALVLAAPSADLGVSIRGSSCPGDQTWCGWTKSCKCDDIYEWDDYTQSCHYAPWPKPQCPKGQQGWCGKSQSDYCEYDAKNQYCWNDGHNQAFCSSKGNLPSKLKDKCPTNHPSCPSTQVWNGGSKSCECPTGKVWRDGKCKHPVMPKPSCPRNQHACCAKSNGDWRSYDESKNECSDNGKHITFCAKPGYEQSYCNSKWN